MIPILKRTLVVLCALFCFAYPFAVIGIAFDVHSPFPLSWAGSAFLFLEGSLLLVAVMLAYGWVRGLLAGLVIITLSYGVEALGVGTGFPFGDYHYTDVLFPRLPGNVPLAVMFAWILIVLGVYGWIEQRKSPWSLFWGAALATLLDLEIEPVATHLEHYWEWLAPGAANYYGVPLTNFLAWFVVALVLLWIMRFVLQPSALTRVVPRILSVASLFMFGLIDLTHGYYGAAILGLLAGGIVTILATLPSRPRLTVSPTDRVQQDQAFQHDGNRMEEA